MSLREDDIAISPVGTLEIEFPLRQPCEQASMLDGMHTLNKTYNDKHNKSKKSMQFRTLSER